MEQKSESQKPESSFSMNDETIERLIVAEYYLTPSTCMPDVPVHSSVETLTICILVLKNGFTVTGESNCVNPMKYNGQLGRRVARANAKQKIWALEGYAIRSRISMRGGSNGSD